MSHARMNFLSLAAILALSGLMTACQVPPAVPIPTARTAAAAAPAAHGLLLDSAHLAALDALIAKTMADTGTPGVAIGIIQDGKLAYAKGYGVLEVGSDRPVTPQSVFLLSSLAKTMTTTSIMQLVEQGKVDLDASVTTYLPDFRLADERYKQITIRQLLSHRSGLPEYDSSTPDYAAHAQNDDGALDRYVHSLNTTTLLSAPGEKFSYSGIGFDILGDIIARVSGMSYEEYVARHIFEPLGMRHSSMLLRDIDPATLFAPHIPGEGGKVIVNPTFPYDRAHAPDSMLFSSIEDMARYMIIHGRRGTAGDVALLTPASYDLMWTKVTDTGLPVPDTGYGLGWMIGDHKGHPVIGHAGLDWGANSFIDFLPEQSAAVMMMTNFVDLNQGVLPAFMLRDMIFDLLLGIEAPK